MDKDPQPSPEFSRRKLLLAGTVGIGVLLAAGLSYNLANNERPIRSSEYAKEPTWSQEFNQMNATRLDTSIWRYETNPEVPTYNDESQAYTSLNENVRIEPGRGMVIEALRKSYQYPNDPQYRNYEYTSGRVDTLHSFSFEYGKVEARMKLPKGEGAWPAFWLLSGNEIHTVGREFTEEELNSERFYTRNGEIDIMEHYGNNPNVVEGTVHTYAKTYEEDITIPDATDAFHTYGIEVSPNSVVWTLDNKPYHFFQKTSDNPDEWPFGDGNHLFVIFNLAMGGPAGTTDPEQHSWRYEVENIRYYEYTGRL